MTQAGTKLIEAINQKGSSEIYIWLDEVLRDDKGSPSPMPHLRESPNSIITWTHDFVDRPTKRLIEENLWLLLKHSVSEYGQATSVDATLYVEALLSVFEEIEALERFKYDLYKLVEQRPFEKLVYGQARNLYLVMLNVYINWLDMVDVEESKLDNYFINELPHYKDTPFFQVALRYFHKKKDYEPYFNFCSEIIKYTNTNDDAYWLVDATEEYFDYTDGNMMLYLSQWIIETTEKQDINQIWWANYKSKVTKWLKRVKKEVKTKQRIVLRPEWIEMVLLMVDAPNEKKYGKISSLIKDSTYLDKHTKIIVKNAFSLLTGGKNNDTDTNGIAGFTAYFDSPKKKN